MGVPGPALVPPSDPAPALRCAPVPAPSCAPPVPYALVPLRPPPGALCPCAPRPCGPLGCPPGQPTACAGSQRRGHTCGTGRNFVGGPGWSWVESAVAASWRWQACTLQPAVCTPGAYLRPWTGPSPARCSQSASRHCGAARRVPMRRGPGCSVSLVAAVWCLAAPATLCLDSRFRCSEGCGPCGPRLSATAQQQPSAQPAHPRQPAASGGGERPVGWTW